MERQHITLSELESVGAAYMEARNGHRDSSECAAEAAGKLIVMELIDTAVRIAHDTGVWRWGDGYGGLVRRWLDEAAEAHGIAEPTTEPKVVKRGVIPPSVRKAVFEADEYRCVHCGGFKSLSIDHIHPVSKGGSDHIDNLQTMCQSCNSSKGDR